MSDFPFTLVQRLAMGLLGALALAGGLHGCVTTKGSLGEANPQGKDIVTASDESDASKRGRVRLELASAYFGRGQMNAALDEVKLAIAADPTRGEAFNLRGLIYANMGEEKLAEESFRRALQLNPRDADTMQNFGYFLCQKKRYAEATLLFDQAIAVPNYRGVPRTLLTKGVCLAFAGELLEAEGSLQRAYDLDPANPSIAVNLSEVLFKRGEYERARFFVRRVNDQPALQGPQTLWLAARIEQRLGNRSGVAELGDQLRKRFPDSREAGAYARGNFDE
jgi:type IV pilus assembly protein PilF